MSKHLRCGRSFGGILSHTSLTKIDQTRGKSFRGQTPETTLDLAKILLEEVHVALVPGEAFGSPGYARISFALGDEELEEGIQRVAE